MFGTENTTFGTEITTLCTENRTLSTEIPISSTENRTISTVFLSSSTEIIKVFTVVLMVLFIKIKVINNQQDPMSNIPVTLIETTTKKRISKNTNAKGEVVFEIKTGKEWAVNILEMKNCSFIYDFDSGYSTGKNLITLLARLLHARKYCVLDLVILPFGSLP